MSSTSANISVYFLQYATAKAEHKKSHKSQSDCFIWTDDEVEPPLKVCIEYKSSKTNENTDCESCQSKYGDILDLFTLWLATMLFHSHAVETTVETGPDLATSSDSKEQYSDSTVRTYPKRYRTQKFPL